MKSEARHRSFPWKCGECRKNTVWPATIDHTSEIAYEGKLHAVRVPQLVVPRCTSCGELSFDVKADEQIYLALRDQLGLLNPEQILQNRKALGLTQKHLGQQLGVAEETLSRWENGHMIQSRAMDNLLRVFFDSREARKILRKLQQDPSLATRATAESLAQPGDLRERFPYALGDQDTIRPTYKRPRKHSPMHSGIRNGWFRDVLCPREYLVAAGR